MIIDELGSAEIRDIVSIAIKDTILAVAVSITIDSIGTKGHIALYSDLSCWIVETKRHKVDEDANNIGLYIDFVMIMFIVCTKSSLSQHHAPPWINDAFLYLL